VKELQTTLGLVAAEMGLCLAPRSVAGLRTRDVVYRPLDNPNVMSPIIMSRRIRDQSIVNERFCCVARDLFRQM
jgi:hypothetical protein